MHNSSSPGVFLSACTLSKTGEASFELRESKWSLAGNLHGEKGRALIDIDTTAETILDLLVEDLPYRKGDEIIAIINGYGSTIRMKMFIITRKIH